MRFAIFVIAIGFVTAEDVRLDNLEPSEAQQYIENKDTSLKYAPKVDSNVPAVRYLGNDPHNVLEDIYLANQYHGQDGLGGYLYGYAVPDIAKTEKKQAGGDLRGAYNYIAGNGQEIKVEYWDDGTGFHQIDNVPKNLPEDLPEVKAAKEEHARLWQEQAERNSRPVESPYNSAGEYASGPLSKQGQLERRQQFAGQQNYQSQYQPQSSNAYQQKVAQSQTPYQQPSQFYAQPQQGFNSGNSPQGQEYSGNAFQQQQVSQQSSSFPQQGSQQQQTGQYAPPAVNSYQPQQPQLSQQSSSSGFQQQGGQSTGQWNQQTSGGQYGAGKPFDSHQKPAGGYQQTGYQKSETDNYSGQYSDNQNTYAQNNDGNEGNEEEQGPPRGFFYNFDYPVGIIVQKQGRANVGAEHTAQKREGNIKDIYTANKELFEKQLAQGRSGNGGSSSSYLHI